MHEMAGNVWWRYLTQSNRFVDDIAATLLEGDSVLLDLPAHMPWYQSFCNIIDEALREAAPLRSLEVIDMPDMPVGEYLLENECRKELRIKQRVGQSCASFLASCDDLTLNDKYLWVRGVEEERLNEWLGFLAEYRKARPRGKECPVFILETTQSAKQAKSVKGMRLFRYDTEVSAYDRFAFSALSIANAGVASEVAPYLSELIANLCQEDVELCGVCAEIGECFMSDPTGYLVEAASQNLRSDASPFEVPGADELGRREWESQLKVAFPMIQRYASQFIERHEKEIGRALPIETEYDTIKDAQELELSHLLGMAARRVIRMSDREYEELSFLRCIRNRLAHMRTVSADDMKRLLTGEFEFALA